MATVTVRIPTPLRAFTGGADTVTARGATVGAVLDDLEAAHPGVRARVLTPEGGVRRYVNLFVGDTHVRERNGLDTPVSEGDEISILPAVAGGGA